MQKIVGSMIVIAVCTALGFEKSNELSMHLNALEELKKLFVLLRSEVQYTKAPFAELFLKISRKMDGVYREWLLRLSKDLEKHEKGTLQEVWKVSVYEYLEESRLTKEELEELCRVGNSLGYLETIELYINQLDFSIEKAREELKSKKKLYQSMGIMCGIFLVIVLL